MLPIRKVIPLDNEYRCAVDIMEVVRQHLKANPRLDTCKVRQLCEMQIEYVHDVEPHITEDSAPCVPPDARY